MSSIAGIITLIYRRFYTR